MRRSISWACGVAVLAAAWIGWPAGLAWASGVYKCPGPPVLYTDAISAKEAKERGCTPLESNPVTVISGPKPRTGPGSGAPAIAGSSSNTGVRVDSGEQRARDSDRKQILASELKKEEQALAAMQAELNNGEPERRGDEKNYQKYLDRVVEMKAGIARKESDVAALKRELSKIP